MVKRVLFFVYGVVCYALFLATFLYAIGFVGNLLVPTSIDTATVSPGWAVLIDLGLIALFGVQHSVMARPWFKRLWTRVIPQPIERSTYVLIANVVTFLLMWQWQGIEAVVCCLDPRKLDPSFAGRRYDAEFLDDLPEDVDPCGERGEFHTFVSAGPVLDQPLRIRVGEVVLREERFAYCDLMSEGS